MTVSYGNGTLPKGSSGGWGLLPADEARLSTLENIQYEYEVFTSIASGTSATIAFPAGSALVVGEYAGQNAIVTVLDASGRPIDQAAKTAAGAVITATLNAGGTYTLSGTPSAYPVGLVYQLRCSAKDAGNIPLASIIDATQVEGTMAKQDANAVAITGGTASLSSLTLSSGTANGVAYLNGSKVLTSGSALTFDGNALTLGGATPRLLANMSGFPQSIRFGIQNSTANGNTRLFLYPNGTGTISAINGTNNSNPDAADFQAFDLAVIGTTDVRLSSNATGAAAFLPLTFYTNGSEQMRLTSTGLGIGTTAPSAKLHIAGDIQQENASYLKGKLSAGTTTRLFGLNALDTLYIGSVDANHTGGTVFTKGGATQMALDANGNLGIGVTPSAWASGSAIDIAGWASFAQRNTNGWTLVGGNVYWDGSTYRYKNSSTAALYELRGPTGVHAWQTAPSGTAGNAITFTQAMTLDASGNLGIGTTSPGNRLHVNGAGDVARFSNGTQNGYLALDSGGFSLLTGAAQTGNGIYASSTANNVQLFTNSTAKVTLDATGNLGIGATPNTSKVVAAGVIESTSGGFKFPDGTTQTTAATGGGGGGVTVKTSTITVSSATYYQYTTSINDATVSAASHINAWLAPNTDWDGDDLIGYDVILTPQSGTIDVCISAPGPIVGTFTLKYFVA